MTLEIYLLIHFICAALALMLALRAFGKITLDILLIAMMSGPVFMLVGLMFEAPSIVVYRKKK